MCVLNNICSITCKNCFFQCIKCNSTFEHVHEASDINSTVKCNPFLATHKKAIQKIHVEKFFSFPEAWKRYREQQPGPKVTYAHVAASGPLTFEISTWTDDCTFVCDDGFKTHPYQPQMPSGRTETSRDPPILETVSSQAKPLGIIHWFFW